MTNPGSAPEVNVFVKRNSFFIFSSLKSTIKHNKYFYGNVKFPFNYSSKLMYPSHFALFSDTHITLTGTKSTIKALEKDVKHVQG